MTVLWHCLPSVHTSIRPRLPARANELQTMRKKEREKWRRRERKVKSISLHKGTKDCRSFSLCAKNAEEKAFSHGVSESHLCHLSIIHPAAAIYSRQSQHAQQPAWRREALWSMAATFSSFPACRWCLECMQHRQTDVSMSAPCQPSVDTEGWHGADMLVLLPSVVLW